MVEETGKRKRNRARKPVVAAVPKKKRKHGWILLIAIGMGLIGIFVGQVVDTKTAITLGIIGLVSGAFGGMAILFGDTLPALQGTEQASQNYLGGNKMPDIDDIIKK